MQAEQNLAHLEMETQRICNEVSLKFAHSERTCTYTHIYIAYIAESGGIFNELTKAYRSFGSFFFNLMPVFMCVRTRTDTDSIFKI